MRIEVVYSPRQGLVDCVELELADGSTVGEALNASGLLQRHPEIDAAQQRIGVWGRRCQPGEALRDGDRVELYRPLAVDPKDARRLRQRRQRGVTGRR